jgi:hypothetical protein
MRPRGILEVMVYNRYHRASSSAFQKAVRIFGKRHEGVDLEADFQLAKALARNFPAKELLRPAMAEFVDWSDADFADLMIHPVEHSYTVEALSELAGGCGLEILMPCITPFGRYRAQSVSWNMPFAERELRAAYEELPDLDRWQVTNLLQHDQSPMIWFYLQRRDSGRRRTAEREICESFLDTRFEPAATGQTSFIREGTGRYRRSTQASWYPVDPPDASVAALVEAADGRRTMRELFAALGRPTDFQSVNEARSRLAVSAYPHVRAAGGRR